MTPIERLKIVAELHDLFSDEQAQFWLTTPNRLIDGRIPAESNFDEVMKLLEIVKATLDPSQRH